MQKSHEEVLWMFLNKREELAENEVDKVIDMEVEEGLEDATRRAVKGVCEVLRMEVPSEEKIKEACDVARGYVPGVVKKEDAAGAAKGKDKKKKGGEAVQPRYFAFMPELDVKRILDERLNKTDVDEEVRRAYTKMKGDGRVTEVPHITVVHSKGRGANADEEKAWVASKVVCGIDGVKEKP
ncbi:hypothetical protein CVT24_010350, partial [Panaeolus cyanescens]